MDCSSCLNEIENKIFYRDRKDGNWKSSPYCLDCINYFIKNSWKDYDERVRQETCKKSLERLISLGPPINIREPKGLPCDNERGEVYELLIDENIISSKVENALEGKDLENYKDFLNKLI